MKNELTSNEIKHLARLARIYLIDEEVASLGEQISAVIDYNMNLLEQVDVSGVSVTTQTGGLINRWGDDEVHPSLSQDQALLNAPAKSEGQFLVKQVLGES
jgi:aspartyl-tRNA(Asn)/glutamyl-tRNA(Gln) amidotransferase subunit C